MQAANGRAERQGGIRQVFWKVHKLKGSQGP